jgi:outer membrane receptor protein involved in Fe transport
MGALDWATAQNRIADTASNEDRTDAFAVLNLTLERTWFNGSVTSVVHFNNLLDHEYHTHTSIGNIPEAGRSVMVSLNYSFR